MSAPEPRSTARATATPPPKPTAADAKAKPQPKRKRVWRWTRRALLAAVALRVLLWLFLQPLADLGAGFAGLSVSWRSASLSLLTLSLSIDDLVVRDAADADAPPLLQAHQLQADLSMRQLLQGNLSVVDVGLAGARVTLHKGADGALRLPASWLQPAPAEAAAPEAAPADAPLDFRLPVAVASTRLHDVQFDFVDHSTEPVTHHTGKLDLDVADLGYTDREGKVLVRLHAPQFCDELFLQATVRAEQAHAKVDWAAAVRGFRPHEWSLPQEVLDSIDGAHVVDLRVDGALRADVLDEAPQVPALDGRCELRLALDGIERTSLDCAFGPTATHAATARTPFSLTLHCDGLVESLRLQDGLLTMDGDRTTVTAAIAAERLTCGRVRPQLEAAGVELPPDGLDVRARLDGAFGASSSLEFGELSLRTDGRELLALPRVAVRDLRADDGALAIAAVELVGPVLPVTQETDGALTVAGLRLRPPASAGGGDDAPPATPPAAGGPALPQLRLGSLSWTGARLTFTDHTKAPAATLSFDDVEVRAEAIAIGADAPPGRLVASARLPGVSERLSLEVAVRPTADAVGADVQLALQDVTLDALRPWLTPLGIEPELTSGAFAMACSADVAFADAAVTAAVRLRNLRFVDGDTTWLKLRAIDGDGVRVAADGTHAGAWTVTEPFVRVHKDERGGLHAFGLALGAPTAAPTPAAPPTTGAAAEPSTAPSLPDSSAPPVHHGALAVAGAMLSWSDAARGERTFDVGLDADVGANDGSGAPIPLRLTLRLDRAVRTFAVDGALTTAPTRTTLNAALDVAGIDGRELQTLLPEGVACSLRDGALHAVVAADIRSEDATSVVADVTGVRLADGETELFAIDRLAVDAPTIGDQVHVAALTLAGARALLTLTDDALHVPGFALAGAPPATAPPSPPQPAPADADVAPPPSAPLVLPKLRVDALTLQLERLEVRDRRGDGERPPIALRTDVRLQAPWVGDPKAEEPDALALVVTGACEPLGARIDADLRISPFALSPTLDLKWRLTGFDTERLIAAMPSLQSQLRGDAKALTVRADVHARLDLRRRDPSRFDLSRPFGAELVVEDLAVEDAATERTFLSVRSIDAILRAFDPRSGAVLLRSLDVDEPVVHLQNTAVGMHAFGFVLPQQPVVEDGAAPPTEPTAPTPPSAPRPAQAAEAAEFAIDHLRVLGLGFELRDDTTTPVTHLRLADSDLELSRFSTRALTEPRPLSFRAALRGGDIELERRVVSSSVISGFVSSAAGAVVGGADRHELEQRPLVDQVTAQGQLQLYPFTKGRVRLAVDALELAAFRGLAKQGGVDLADGLYDMRLSMDLKGHDGIDVKSQHVLTYLHMSEPPDGPISTYLRLPAPLQTVLFLLRNNNDEQRLPLNLHIPSDGLTSGQVADLAVESLVRIISDAVGSAGGRAATTITGALFGADNTVPEVSAECAFPAGSPLPQRDEAGDAALAAVLDAAADDETLVVVLLHDLGAGDTPHAAALATPPAGVVEATVARLQENRRALEDARAPLARDVVALYAAGKSQEALRQHGRLQDVDAHIGELEEALREALDMLGQDNARRARRRARDAARALADARLDAVTERILHSGKRLEKGRLERRPGRGLPVDGVDGGGRVRVVLQRRSAGQ